MRTFDAAGLTENTVKALVVNCSDPHYSLGAAKLADWLREQGHEVDTWGGDPGWMADGYDLVCLSVVFSWHAPIARAIADRVKHQSDVWCGGPGMTRLVAWWKESTGLDCTPGVDYRFERTRGDYPYTFAARGCPVGCKFCVVPKLEGVTFTLDWDFRPAPVLCDNNLSALPDEFQDHILKRYAESGVALLDCNSGFEPRTFTEATYRRWKGKFKGAWRFAYDEQLGSRGRVEIENVYRMMWLLRKEPARKKQVYVLVGNEPFDVCYERAIQVIEWGGEPHCQFMLPLDCLDKTTEAGVMRPRYQHADWTYRMGRDFCRYFNTRGWRSYPLSEYKPRINEPPPFRDRLAA